LSPQLVSVAKGPKFQPKNIKRAEKYFQWLGKYGAEFLTDLSKKGRKEANIFEGLVFHKII
jgi:hypothetical protein